MQREKLSSRLGFILLSAGCAIGIGNVWKFPYMVGQNGGGIFVVMYLIFLAILGIPVMTMEFSVGRAAQKSPACMCRELEKAGTHWHWHGYAAVAGNYVLMMFYTCVAGWMLQYFVDMTRGSLTGLTTDAVAGRYQQMLGNPVLMTMYMAIIVMIGFAVCSIGLHRGLDRVTKVMMLALLAIMVVLAVYSVCLPGGREGLSFYLKPNLDTMRSVGVGNVIVAAMNQAFFTLSLGIGAMAIFGSYIGRERALLGESIHVAVLDTFVAITSGLIIFPACATYGVQVNSGRSLIFITLPNVFNSLPMGRLWGSVFFLFMTFAALSTVLAVFEAIIACTCDLTGWNRKKACVVNCVAMFVLSMPCVLGFNVFSDFIPFGGDTSIMDVEDLIVSNILLPLGSLCMVLFCTRKNGWGWDAFRSEANTGCGPKIGNWMRGYVSYVLPVVILIVFVIGMYNFFA